MTQRDDKGNVRVDFAWGNFPMQPNDDRLDGEVTILDQSTSPVLGTGDSHNVNAIAWDNYPNVPNNNGSWNEGDLIWPSLGVCYQWDPKMPGNTWQDFIEYLRDCGVNPNILKEATFVGGEDKYDWQNGSYDDGIIFWSYIDPTYVVWVNWETGYVLTGKDFDGKIIGGNRSAGSYLGINAPINNFWFTALTCDPSKNNTAGWLG